MNTYTPDSWTILRMVTPEETIYKVLAGWYGSFATGDSWKVSSGITDVIIHNNLEGVHYYELPQYSGSTYICLKNSEHMSGIMASMLTMWQKQAETGGFGNIEAISMEEFIAEWDSK